MPAEPEKALLPFGFTGLESEIYAFLLKESPATGYRVAQAIGKAAANAYKAIEALQQKGAIIVEEGPSRLCRAVPSDELLTRLTREFEWKRAEAELSLSRLNAPTSDDRVYTLRSSSQVIERARHMIADAESVALVAGSGRALGELAEALRARGKTTYALCPEKVEVAHYARIRLSADELRVVVEGTEMLVALFDARENTAFAVWHRGYLAAALHRGLAAEMLLAGLNPPALESLAGYRETVQNLTAV